VRWYEADTITDSDLIYIEVYNAYEKIMYKAHGLQGALSFVERKPHYFKDVPASVFYLHEQEENIFNSIITLNDAYNELQSAEIDDFQEWVDAYLMLTGVDADAEDIAAMKQQRVLVLPSDASASWVTKNANDTQIVNMLDNIKKNIFKVTACPDMADENFLAQSGTALAYKLVGFENVASAIVARFTKAIQRRVELICNVLNLKATDAVWRDIHINFVRNLPVNMAEAVQLVSGLHGVVSDKTLLAQLPFINDIDSELEALQEQKEANMQLYSFGAAADHEEDTAQE
jgi:SPP1 family phage portal protein